YDSMVSLQHDLTNVAKEGNERIKEIQDSKEPAEAKVTQIVAAIHQYRALANMVAAKYSGNVFDAMQRILDEEGTGQSARQFAQAHGVNVGQMFRHPDDQQDLAVRVKGMLDAAGSPMGTTQGFAATPKPPPIEPGGPPAPTTSEQPIAFTQGFSATPGEQKLPGGPPAGAVSNMPIGVKPTFSNTPPLTGRSPAPAAPTPAAGPMAAATAPLHGGTSLPGAPMVGAPSSGLTTTGATSLTGTPAAPTSPVQPVTPADLMHSFDKGMQAGNATAGAVPPPQLPPAEPQAPTTPTAGMGNVPVNAPAYDSPPPVAHAAAPDATPPPQVVAGSAAPAAPSPAGPLPAYASDIRPTIPAASAPVLPPSPPPSAMPGSALVHPSAGQGSPAQPAVVRQAPPPAPPSSPSSLGTEAVAATATGAIAGAASANATERARLERLVAAVARQQPRLAWAAGNRPDETTVLTTDLASGWIPPGIELPAAVTLLSPERRRGDLETLLGEVTVATGYTPIHYVPEEDEPIPTSPRPRHLADIDDLGWELNQATQWRDGLPRLAHTLAKAASSGTGVLDREVDLLQTHLREVSTRVLDSYPEQVDFHDIGNWQLLAAIDALVAGDKPAATYHFAWFQACSTTIGKAQH
ncbi:MAG: hypothetical protein QOE30_1088, partial [Mycobacterium sp.]|uniref:DUF5631 domain-containing protein n=1 Tax=Mycobacterium sp. TaxID=1785 RepID=UPI0028B982EE